MPTTVFPETPEAILARKETRREQLRQQIRLDILQATAQLIAQKGVNSLSMDEVAALSGLSKGSLYNYFENRDELIWMVIDTYNQHFFERAAPLLTQDSPSFRERFTALVDLILDTLETQTGLACILDYFEEQTSQARFATKADGPMLKYVRQFHERFEPFFSKAIAHGEVRGSNPMDISVTFVSAIFHLFEFSRIGLLHSKTSEQRQFVLDLFLR